LLLVSFSSSLSVIIYQQEEGIYLDGIVYSRIRTHGRLGPASKVRMGLEYSADIGTELLSHRGIARSVCDGELALYFLFKLPLPP